MERLGYYRRARALHGAAKEVVRRGFFPRTTTELMELPGVGRYTAAAVASIAFGEPVAVVDGNVKRVIDRIVNHKAADSAPANEKQYWEIAGQLLDRQSPGDFNQAMMELGAWCVCRATTVSCLSRGGPVWRSWAHGKS